MSIQEQALAHWDLINKLARRRFQKETLAEEAALFVLDSIQKDNWKKLKQFSGKARFSTFFASVTYRLLEDFARKKYGRITPPKWIQEAGGIWILLFRLLCMERYSFTEAVHLANNRRQNLSRHFIESKAETVLGKIPECGKADVTVSYDDEARSAGFCRRENDTTIELKEKAEYFKALGMALFDNTIPDTQTPHLARLLEHPITLTIEERLLLKLCYQESFTVTEAGKKLGLNRFQAHGRLKRALQKIKKQFQDAGYEKELKLFLQSS